VFFCYVDDNVVHVDGTLMKVPDPAMNTELLLCNSFISNTSSGDSGRIVVLAHHTDDPTKLSAYFSFDNQCFIAPIAGNYIFAIFLQNSDSTLEAPATPPEILIRTKSMMSCKYSFLDHSPHNSQPLNQTFQSGNEQYIEV